MKLLRDFKHISKLLLFAFFLTVLNSFPFVFQGFSLQTKIHAQGLPNGSTAYPIYGLGATTLDQLHPNWTARTYLNDVNEYNPVNTDPVYSGTHSISWTDKGPKDYVDFVAPSPIDISQYNFLSFYGRATQVGQLYGAQLLDTAGQPIGTPLPFAQYGGVPQPSTWFVYNFPLASMAGGATQIGGVRISEITGSAQPALFLDDITLSRAQGQQTTPTPQLNATVTITPLPTPEPFYYPDISPWVFIIPGIIIFIAVLFQ